MDPTPLHDLQVISLAVNVPGPTAAARLHQLGARVTKIEPPGGDPLGHWLPAWYHALSDGQEILKLDLKQSGDQQRLGEMLSTADLLLTSIRLSALCRLGLDWETLTERYPRLCQVAILGYPSPEDDRAGHDLNYQARSGLVDPPHLPRSLVADLAGAERAVSAALALLLARERGQGSGYAEVSLAEAAEGFAYPLQHGATVPGGPLGGGFPGYGLYRTQEGWISLATLEEHFWQKLNVELGFDPVKVQAEDLQRVFLTQPASYWETWAKEKDLPILAVRDL